MKRKWIIMGDEKKFLRDTFELNDQQLNDVKRFMEQEFHSMPELMKLLINSKLCTNQKILASYIMGNTVAVQMIRDMKNTTEENRSDTILDMAG